MLRCTPLARLAIIANVLVASMLAQSSIPQLVVQIQRSVVTVIAAGGKTQGTGFFVGADLIVTNAHVVRGEGKIIVKNRDGSELAIQGVIASDRNHDVAVMKVFGIGKPLPLNPTLPAPGERIFVIGNPLGLEQTVTDGIISAVRNVPGTGDFLQISAPISPGSSGSPVIDGHGTVVGMATFKLTEGENLNFAVPAASVLALMPSSAPSRPMPAPARATKAADPFIEGMGLFMKEDFAGALPFMELAASRRPSDADVWYYLGACNTKLERYRQAVDAYQVAVKLKPEDAAYHYNLGIALFTLGLLDKAQSSYEKALQLKPDFVEVYCSLANLHSSRDRLSEAESLYRAAIERAPNYTRSYLGLARVYGKQGKSAQQIEAYERLLKIEPNSPQVRYDLGISYLTLGDRASALQQYVVLKNIDVHLADSLYRAIYK